MQKAAQTAYRLEQMTVSRRSVVGTAVPEARLAVAALARAAEPEEIRMAAVAAPPAPILPKAVEVPSAAISQAVAGTPSLAEGAQPEEAEGAPSEAGATR